MELPQVFIVSGLLYGDEGKGTTVEYLCETYNAHLVVRYSGGPQAMHHIVRSGDNIVHCFSQFGAATFKKDRKTLLGKYMLVSPHHLLNEEHHLQTICGVTDAKERLFIDENCFVITPLHQLVNRVLETLRGSARYGTTGMGVGSTADDICVAYPNFFPNANSKIEVDKKPTCLQVKHFKNKNELMEQLRNMYSEKMDQVRTAIKSYSRGDYSSLFDPKYLDSSYVGDKNAIKEANDFLIKFVGENTLDSLTNFYFKFGQDYSSCIVDGCQLLTQHMQRRETIIFEGSQGALLDRVYGIFPHITRTTCSTVNAIQLLQETNLEYKSLTVGVLRAYSSRHGNGPFTTNDPTWFDTISEDHNSTTKWQGSFRIGPFDAVAVRYGTQIFGAQVVSLTCLDKIIQAAIKSEKIAELPICTKYFVSKEIVSEEKLEKLLEYEQSENGYVITQIKKGTFEDHYRTMNLLHVLKYATPMYETNKKAISEDYHLKNQVIEYVDKHYPEHIEIANKVADYVVVLQSLIGLPIRILSFGPTSDDKVNSL
jgi:adenylosuccinate synthase